MISCDDDRRLSAVGKDTEGVLRRPELFLTHAHDWPFSEGLQCPSSAPNPSCCYVLAIARCIDRWLGEHASCCVCKADLEEMARAARKPCRSRSLRKCKTASLQCYFMWHSGGPNWTPFAGTTGICITISPGAKVSMSKISKRRCTGHRHH